MINKRLREVKDQIKETHEEITRIIYDRVAESDSVRLIYLIKKLESLSAEEDLLNYCKINDIEGGDENDYKN